MSRSRRNVRVITVTQEETPEGGAVPTADFAAAVFAHAAPAEVCDVIDLATKGLLSDRHRPSSQAGATLDGFLEVGWGRVFYFVNRAGVMAVEDADGRVSHHTPETVGVTARGMASLFPQPGGGS